MAMQSRSFPRSTAPDMTVLANSLRPLLTVADAGSFHLRTEPDAVIVEQASFSGVDLAAVQTAVNAAPVATPQSQAKANIDQWPVELKALFLLLVDEINRLRTDPSRTFPAITYQQAWNAVKAKADTL
jgi:hypothetical protein